MRTFKARKHWLMVLLLLNGSWMLTACTPQVKPSTTSFGKIECGQAWSPVTLPAYPVAPYRHGLSDKEWIKVLTKYAEDQMVWAAQSIAAHKDDVAHAKGFNACVSAYNAALSKPSGAGTSRIP